MRVLVAGVAIAAVATACSEPATLETYAPAAEGLSQGYVEEAQALSFDYQSSVEDGVRGIVETGVANPESAATALVLEETVAYLAMLIDTMGRYLEAFDALDAPSEISAEHDDYVAAIGIVHGSLPSTKAEVETASRLDDVQLALTSSGFADGQLRWTASCSALEQAVRDQGMGINLRCVAPTPTP